MVHAISNGIRSARNERKELIQVFCFQVESDTGRVVLESAVPTDAHDVTFQVVATDAGTPPLESHALVTVSVQGLSGGWLDFTWLVDTLSDKRLSIEVCVPSTGVSHFGGLGWTPLEAQCYWNDH